MLLGTIADTGERENEGVAAIEEIFFRKLDSKKKIEERKSRKRAKKQ